MTCNLIKEVVSLKNKEGKAKSFTNYYLEFENGYKLPITCRMYDTSKLNEDKREILEKVNFSNSQMINAFADDVSNGKK